LRSCVYVGSRMLPAERTYPCRGLAPLHTQRDSSDHLQLAARESPDHVAKIGPTLQVEQSSVRSRSRLSARMCRNLLEVFLPFCRELVAAHRLR
jgi:hypothetical protein